MFPISEVLFFASICIFVDITYKGNSNFINPLYDQLKSQYNNSIPHDLIMRFYIADVPNNIITNNPYNGSYDTYLECVRDSEILKLKPKTRSEHNFKNVNLIMNSRTYTNSSFVDVILTRFFSYEAILVNQMIYAFNDFETIVISDPTNQDRFILLRENLDEIDYFKEPLSAFSLRIIGIVRIIFGLFLASNITSIYFLMIIIGIPIFILAIIECFLKFFDHAQINNFRITLYRTFPWLGIYLHAIHLNNKKQVAWLLMSQVGVLTIFYCIYVSLFEFLDTLLFIWSFPLGINIKFYILIAVLELGSFMFVRTRTSLKYFPKFIFLFLFMFCFYIQFNSYAFYDEAFVCIVLATISLLLLFIIFIEIPALSWNPSFHYTPSVEKPRTLYNPLFSMSWYYDLPHLWTMFFPLHDRSTFTENEMALIDRKYLVLSQLLNPQQEASEDIFHDNHQLQGVIQFDINTINYNNRYEEIIHRSENENMNNLLPNNQYRNSE